MKQQAPPVRGISEKKEKFLLWLKKREADEKNTAEEQAAQADPAYRRAMMVWADDGGRISETIEGGKTYLGA